MRCKQEIYRELLSVCLPSVRNRLSSRLLLGRRRREAYALSQLCHNLWVSILDPNFGNHDVWFLNYQARAYVESSKGSLGYEAMIRLIRELFLLVPDGLRNELTWQ